MKAVIYDRYSSDSQREESIGGQIRECKAFAKKNDITILRHYIDRAVSAKTDNCPRISECDCDATNSKKDSFCATKVSEHRKTKIHQFLPFPCIFFQLQVYCNYYLREVLS